MEFIFIIAAVSSMYLMYKLLFGSWDELAEALGFWLTPDVISLFRGEAMEDFIAEFKLGIMIFSGIGTYIGLSGLFNV